MIVGIGHDLVDIRRIEKALKRFGARFEQRVFTAREIAMAEKRRGRKTATLARRFAAKEAAAKALATGFQSGVAMRDIEIINDALGRPQLHLHGGALARLESLLPENHSPRLHITLADEYPYASAFVVIEAVKA